MNSTASFVGKTDLERELRSKEIPQEDLVLFERFRKRAWETKQDSAALMRRRMLDLMIGIVQRGLYAEMREPVLDFLRSETIDPP